MSIRKILVVMSTFLQQLARCDTRIRLRQLLTGLRNYCNDQLKELDDA